MITKTKTVNFNRTMTFTKEISNAKKEKESEVATDKINLSARVTKPTEKAKTENKRYETQVRPTAKSKELTSSTTKVPSFLLAHN